MLLVLAAVAAASASSHSSVRSKFNEQGSQTLVGANATLGNATYGSGSSKHIFSVAGPGSDAGIVSLTAAGAAAADAFDPSQAEGDELYVMYTLDLQPPLGGGPHLHRWCDRQLRVQRREHYGRLVWTAARLSGWMLRRRRRPPR